MNIHHFNCGTMRPFTERLIHGRGSYFAAGRMVCHCLLIESRDGLVLVDTGVGLDDCAQPAARLGKTFVAVVRPTLDPEETAARQIERLGHRRNDVRHIVVTHLDLDHAGGLADFPNATVHVYRDEHDAAHNPRTVGEKHRYRACQWAHGPNWRIHAADGERFEGFEAVRAVVEPEILLLPTMGHSRGHAVVAIKNGDGWLLHCGDAYFSQHEMNLERASCPPGLAAFQRLVAVDDRARRKNQRRLRELKRAHSNFELFSAHDGDELAMMSHEAELASATTVPVAL
jgi:glyoxylase-like metal-dependent hydrolase (beta-lactamase superfamily II)